MLQQLALQPGQRVLEIGAGTGYNAALLGQLVGPAGHVTTIDIDEDLAIAAHAIEILGGALRRVVAAPSAVRTAGTVVIIDKVRSTPSAYPRRPGVPARKAL